MPKATLTSSSPPPPPPPPPPQAASVTISATARKNSGRTRPNRPFVIETSFSVYGGTPAGRDPELWFLEGQYSYATLRGQASGWHPCYGAALPVGVVCLGEA